MKYKFEKPLHGFTGIEKYQCTIEWRNGKIISDEPIEEGGKDTGPDPHSLLLSSLASCTLITLRMYIDRKGWNIPEITVNVNMYSEIHTGKTITVLDRDIQFNTPVSAEQKTRLAEIVKHCPVSIILENEIKIRTFIFHDEATEKIIHYTGNEITVNWKPEFCQHSTRCFTQLPGVFNPGLKKWINPDGAPANKIIEQVRKCPSGALTINDNSK